jgi:hypothetical protein
MTICHTGGEPGSPIPVGRWPDGQSRVVVVLPPHDDAVRAEVTRVPIPAASSAKARIRAFSREEFQTSANSASRASVIGTYAMSGRA